MCDKNEAHNDDKGWASVAYWREQAELTDEQILAEICAERHREALSRALAIETRLSGVKKSADNQYMAFSRPTDPKIWPGDEGWA